MDAAAASEFYGLISKLTSQYETDIRDAVGALEEENRRLREEVWRLRSGGGGGGLRPPVAAFGGPRGGGAATAPAAAVGVVPDERLREIVARDFDGDAEMVKALAGPSLTPARLALPTLPSLGGGGAAGARTKPPDPMPLPGTPESDEPATLEPPAAAVDAGEGEAVGLLRERAVAAPGGRGAVACRVAVKRARFHDESAGEALDQGGPPASAPGGKLKLRVAGARLSQAGEATGAEPGHMLFVAARLGGQTFSTPLVPFGACRGLSLSWDCPAFVFSVLPDDSRAHCALVASTPEDPKGRGLGMAHVDFRSLRRGRPSRCTVPLTSQGAAAPGGAAAGELELEVTWTPDRGAAADERTEPRVEARAEPLEALARHHSGSSAALSNLAMDHDAHSAAHPAPQRARRHSGRFSVLKDHVNPVEWFQGEAAETEGLLQDDPSRALRIPAAQMMRFCDMFNVHMWKAAAARVTADSVWQVLRDRGVMVAKQRVSEVMEELLKSDLPTHVAARNSELLAAQDNSQDLSWQKILGKRFKRSSSINSAQTADEGAQMPFRVFVGMMLFKDIGKKLPASVASDVTAWQRAFLTQDVQEVIARLSRAHQQEQQRLMKEKTFQSTATTVGGRCFGCRINMNTQAVLSVLNVVVVITVLVSVVSLALSMDYCYECGMWLAIEVVCTIVFCGELALKLYIFGCHEFFRGVDWRWNWADVFITIFAVFDLFMTILAEVSDVPSLSSVGRFSLALRVLRIMRMARLMKMLRSPLVSELANMLSGFMIGMPALLWVLVLIWVVLWVLATALRHVVGPKYGETLLEGCGSGDNWTPELEEAMPECRQHKLYGEEYCPNVTKCMFTVFRCMVGDCTSAAGQSLPAHLSRGYDFYFDVVYCVGMIVLIFGLFNVITAVFVESTMKGLTTNDVKVKLQTTYRAMYVKRKLEELVRQMWKIHCMNEKMEDGMATGQLSRFSDDSKGSIFTRGSRSSKPDDWRASDANHVTFSEDDFYNMLVHPKVQQILEELDIDLGTSNTGLFDIFRVDENGRVSIPELLNTLMKLRGSTSKADLIAPWMAMSGLEDEIQDIQEMIVNTHQSLLHNQRNLLAAHGLKSVDATPVTRHDPPSLPPSLPDVDEELAALSTSTRGTPPPSAI